MFTMKEIKVGQIVRDSRNEQVYTIIEKNSKCKTVMLEAAEGAEGKTVSTSVTTLNKYYEEVVKEETTVADEPVITIEAEQVIEEHVDEVVEETPVKVKKDRKPREKKDNPARVEFTKKALEVIEEAGYSVKIWENIPNLFAVKSGKKNVGEVRTGLKQWTLNTKIEIAERMGVKYTTQKYYSPATVKFDYTNFESFKSFISNIVA